MSTNEWRDALQRLVDAFGRTDVEGFRELCEAYDRAKALLARGEPEIDYLDGLGEILDLAEKARALAVTNDERRKLNLPSKQLMMEPEQFLAVVGWLNHADALSREPAAAEKPQPVAYVPVHPRNGPLWASTIPSLDSDHPKSYELMPLYAAAAAEKAREWQPIESAPNDVSILVSYDDGHVELKDAEENTYDWGPYKGRLRGMVCPTHWMPSPPAATGETKCE